MSKNRDDNGTYAFGAYLTHKTWTQLVKGGSNSLLTKQF